MSLDLKFKAAEILKSMLLSDSESYDNTKSFLEDVKEIYDWLMEEDEPPQHGLEKY